VKITATDGTKISANEVKQWISSFTIDPVSFIDAPKKVQFETIQRIAGIDTTEIDNKINEKSGTLYMQRTAQYQIATMKEKARDDMLDSGQQISFTPEVDVSEAMKQLQSINEYNNDLAARQSKLDRMREEIKSMKVQEESIDAELQQLELKKQELISKKNDISTKRADVTQQGINLSKEVTDLDFKSTTEIENRISSAKSITESNQRYNQYQRLKEEAEAERIKWKELDDLIDQLRQQKDDMIKNANYPIEGMRVTEQE
jgi:chromosome segregation ATPase